jgi:hypothetical protein
VCDYFKLNLGSFCHLTMNDWFVSKVDANGNVLETIGQDGNDKPISVGPHLLLLRLLPRQRRP